MHFYIPYIDDYFFGDFLELIILNSIQILYLPLGTKSYLVSANIGGHYIGDLACNMRSKISAKF